MHYNKNKTNCFTNVRVAINKKKKEKKDKII